MRSILVAVLVFAGFTPCALAQAGPYLGTVSESGATLRAGPGQAFDVTSNLHTGDMLLVDHEENGWLAVQDAPGKIYSLSWVPMQFVNFDKSKPTPQNVTVEEEVILAPGTLGSDKPSVNFRRTKVPAGSILTVIGPKVALDGKSWYPVVPPSGDFRYIAKQLVKYEKPVNTSFAIRSGPDSLPSAPPPTAATPPGSSIPPQSVAAIPAIGPPIQPAGSTSPGTPASGGGKPPAPIIQHPLWIQAEAAEKDGRLTDAVNLYFQLARLMNEPGGDHDIANMCYTRIHAIREKQNVKATGTTTSTTRPALTTPTQTPTQTKAMPSAISTTETGSGNGNGRPDFIGTGTLKSSALWFDGKRTFALDGSPGTPICYVVAGPGVEVERYLNRQVNLYGTSSTRKDSSKPLVVATSVEVAQ